MDHVPRFSQVTFSDSGYGVFVVTPALVAVTLVGITRLSLPDLSIEIAVVGVKDWQRRLRAEMEIASIVGLACFIAACFLAALTGAFFHPGEWYERLKKPSWRPPNRLFAPVWTVLYVMIAVAGWLVWRKAGFAGAGLPLAVYALQLILNGAWSPLFFGLHRPDLGFADIILVWMSIIATIVLFYPIHVIAAFLLVPYLAWVTFATALNFAVWRLNSVASPQA